MPIKVPTFPTSGQKVLTGDVEVDPFSNEATIVGGTVVEVSKNDVSVGTQPEINFIEGSNVTLTVTEDTINQRIDVEIASSGGGSGGHTIRDDGSDMTGRDNLNFVSSTTVSAIATDDAGNNETEVTFERAALSGAIAASANSNATLFSGIRDNGATENDRTNLNFVPGTFITVAVTDDVGNDELEISYSLDTNSLLAAIASTSIVINSSTLERAALSGAISASQNSNTTLFAGILDNGAAENDRQNLNFLSTTSIIAAIADDAGNNELEITWQRAALTGAIAASQNSNSTLFSGIRVDGASTTDRSNINFIAGTGVTLTPSDDAGNDEIEITISATGAVGDIVWTMAAVDELASAATNAAAIQTLIDGGVTHIQLPEGLFEIDSINFVSDVYMRGMGIDLTTLKWANRSITTDPGSQGPLNIHGVSLSHISRVILQDFTVDGNKAGVTVSGSGNSLDIECISSTFADDCRYIRVKVINAEGDGFDYDDCSNCYTEDCEAANCDGFGCHNSLRTTRNRHLRFKATNCGTVHSRGGMDAHGTAPDESTENEFIDCVAISCYRGLLLGGHRNTVSNYRSDSCTNTGIRITGNDNSLSSCIAEATTGNNYTIDAGDRNTLNGCIARDATSSGGGFVILTGSTNNTLTGCQAHSNAGNGFQLNSGSSNNSIVNPQSTSNSTANFSDAGSNNTIIDPNGAWRVAGSTGTSGQVLTSAGSSAVPTWSSIGASSFSAVAAKTVLANATNSSAVPTFVAGSAAFQYFRVNSGNTGLEWGTLSPHASTSLVFNSNTFERAALTGAIAASQNSNATLFSGILANGSATTDRANINFISGSGVTVTATDDAANNEIELTFSATAASVTPTTISVFGTPTNTGVPFIIYVSFAAGTPGTADDVTVFSSTAPFNFRILEAWLVTNTAITSSTVQARTAAGGLGSALTTAMSSTIAGKFSDNSTATTTVSSGGSMFLRRSDRGVAGEFFAMCVRT